MCPSISLSFGRLSAEHGLEREGQDQVRRVRVCHAEQVGFSAIGTGKLFWFDPHFGKSTFEVDGGLTGAGEMEAGDLFRRLSYFPRER